MPFETPGATTSNYERDAFSRPEIPGTNLTRVGKLAVYTGTLGLGLSAACTDAGQDEGVLGSAKGRDGRVIESHEPYLPAEQGFRISPHPEVEIGDEGWELGAEALDRVTFAAVSSDGRIVLAHHTTPMLRWYSREGEFLFGTGRPGGGPGEFSGGDFAPIQRGWYLRGDSIATWEVGVRRMQVFDPEGRYARSVSLGWSPEMPGTPQMVGRLGDGFVVSFVHANHVELSGGLWQTVVSYHRFREDGSHAGPIAEDLPGRIGFLLRNVEEGRLHLASFEAYAPFAPHGVAQAAGDHLYYGWRDRWEISVFDSTGALQMIVRRQGERRPFTRSDVARYREWRHADLPAGAHPAALDRVLDQLPYPERLPAFRGLFVDREGWLWVEEYPLPWEPMSTWVVFDPEGRWASTVELPAGSQIRDIGTDYVLLLETDGLDVERVRRYALHGRP